MASTLSASSQQANKTALNAALTENPEKHPATKSNENDVEPGEIQEVDMQAQADSIRTVFSDPTNFNVKVGPSLPPYAGPLTLHRLAPALLSVDALVRFSSHKKPESSPDPQYCAYTAPSHPRCSLCAGMDGGHQASDQL